MVVINKYNIIIYNNMNRIVNINKLNVLIKVVINNIQNNN